MSTESKGFLLLIDGASNAVVASIVEAINAQHANEYATCDASPAQYLEEGVTVEQAHQQALDRVALAMDEDLCPVIIVRDCHPSLQQSFIDLANDRVYDAYTVKVQISPWQNSIS